MTRDRLAANLRFTGLWLVDGRPPPVTSSAAERPFTEFAEDAERDGYQAGILFARSVQCFDRAREVPELAARWRMIVHAIGDLLEFDARTPA